VREGRLFKYGSGTGSNFTSARAFFFGGALCSGFWAANRI
jgi:hypothetical protein